VITQAYWTDDCSITFDSYTIQKLCTGLRVSDSFGRSVGWDAYGRRHTKLFRAGRLFAVNRTKNSLGESRGAPEIWRSDSGRSLGLCLCGSPRSSKSISPQWLHRNTKILHNDEARARRYIASGVSWHTFTGQCRPQSTSLPCMHEVAMAYFDARFQVAV